MPLDSELDGFGIDGFAVFDVVYTAMQNIPKDDSDFVGHGPDGLVVTEPYHELPENHLQVAPLGADGSLGHLAQHAADIAVAFGTATGVVLAGRFLHAGANSDPAGEVGGRLEGSSHGTQFGEDLLRGFRADSGNLDQAFNDAG